jgi:hypothetical protein
MKKKSRKKRKRLIKLQFKQFFNAKNIELKMTRNQFNFYYSILRKYLNEKKKQKKAKTISKSKV